MTTGVSRDLLLDRLSGIQLLEYAFETTRSFAQRRRVWAELVKLIKCEI